MPPVDPTSLALGLIRQQEQRALQSDPFAIAGQGILGAQLRPGRRDRAKDLLIASALQGIVGGALSGFGQRRAEDATSGFRQELGSALTGTPQEQLEQLGQVPGTEELQFAIQQQRQAQEQARQAELFKARQALDPQGQIVNIPGAVQSAAEKAGAIREAQKGAEVEIARAGRPEGIRETALSERAIEDIFLARGFSPIEAQERAQEFSGARLGERKLIEEAADTAAAISGTETELIAPIAGRKRTTEQIKVANDVATKASPLFVGIGELEKIISDPGFDPTQLGGPRNQRASQILGNLFLDFADFSGRGANLTENELKRLSQAIGVNISGGNVLDAIRAGFQEEFLNNKNIAALQNFRDLMELNATQRLKSANFNPKPGLFNPSLGTESGLLQGLSESTQEQVGKLTPEQLRQLEAELAR